MSDTVVIVGAGRCGASAAETLSSAGFGGKVVLIGEEVEPPYERPPLSKEYLRGEQDPGSLLVRPRQWYAEAGIDLRTGVRVTALDCGSRTVQLSSGEHLGYGRLLLATGGRPRTLPGGHPMVRYLRTLADADRLRGELASCEHIVIVGAGFIGAEAAASARALGIEVTMLEVLEVPLANALGTEIGALYAGIHRAHGVRLLTGEGLAGVTDAPGGAVRVHTTRGRPIDCDLVVAGVGITPATELAEAAGIAVGNGVLVDELCRTSAPDVYAAGDVANHFHPLAGRHIRVEHYDNAIRQGATAARTMMGKNVPYDEPHWFWSDQYEANLQYVGHAAKWDRLVLRGSLTPDGFSAFYLAGQAVQAALSVNRPKDILRARKMIRERRQVDATMLADESVDLRKA